MTAVAILLALLTGAVFFFTPFSTPTTDRWLQARWTDLSPCFLEFERAEIALSRGSIELTRPQVYDPDRGDAFIDLRSVRVRFSPASIVRLLFDDAPVVSVPEIRLQGPILLAAEERDGAIAPGPNLRLAADLLRSAIEAPPGRTRVELGRIVVDGVELRLDRVSSEGRRPLVVATDCRIRADFEGKTTPRLIAAAGEFRGEGGAARFTARTAPREEFDEFPIDLTLEKFDSVRHLLVALPVGVRSDGFSARFNVRERDDGQWGVHASMRDARIALVGLGDDGREHAFDSATLDASVVYSEALGRVSLERLRLSSAHSDFEASGTLALTEPHAYRVSMTRAEARGSDLALIRRRFLGKAGEIVGPRSRVVARGEFSGELGDWPPRSVRAEYEVEGLTLHPPGWPEPWSDVHISGVVTEKQLTVHSGRASAHGVELQFDGGMEGRPLAGEIDRIAIDVRTAGQVAAVSAPTRPTGLSGVRFRGAVNGAWSVRLERPEMGPLAEILGRAELDGRLQFSNATVESERLAEPIRELSGALAFTRREARLDSLRGRIGDAAFTLAGRVGGPDVFWTDAATTLALTASFRAESVSEYVTWFGAEPPDLHPVSGAVTVSARVSGPLEDWKSMTFRGTATAENLATPIRVEGMAGQVAFPRIELVFEPDRIEALPAEGSWEGLSVHVDRATLRPEGGSAQLTVVGELEGFRGALPGLLQDFERVGGKAMVTHRIELERTVGRETEARTLLEAWTAIEPIVRRPNWSFSEAGVVRNEGEARLDRAELLFKRWPETAAISEILGVLHYEGGGRAWTEAPISLKAGQGAESLRVDARFDPAGDDAPFTMSFDVRGGRADLDDWINTQWGRGGQEPQPVAEGLPTAFDPNPKPIFRLNVRASTASYIYRGLEGRDLTGSLLFESYSPPSGRLQWSNVRGGYGDGRIGAEGSLRWKGSERMARSYQVEATRMHPRDLVRLGLGEETPTRFSTGIVSGRLSLEGDGPPKSPLNGSGRITVDDTRILSNPILIGLGDLLGLQGFFNDISFTRIDGGFRVADSSVIFDADSPITFDPPSRIHPLSMNLVGRVGPSQRLDLTVSLRFASNWPVVGVLNPLLGKLLRYHVRGTLAQPTFTILP